MDFFQSSIWVSCMQFNVSFDSACLTDGFPKCCPFPLYFSLILAFLQPRSSVLRFPASLCPHLLISAALSSLSLSEGLSADDTITLCAARTKDNIGGKARPGGFLIRMLLQREKALDTDNGCSKLHLQQRWQSLFLFHFSLSHTHTHQHTQQALR